MPIDKVFLNTRLTNVVACRNNALPHYPGDVRTYGLNRTLLSSQDPQELRLRSYRTCSDNWGSDVVCPFLLQS
ncbi:hypothetical protein CFRS1_v011365 [Colletotrichum fructicola]|nr:hypothetical protein CFRS1_v011365 [Colletotrichum fructicola]